MSVLTNITNQFYAASVATFACGVLAVDVLRSVFESSKKPESERSPLLITRVMGPYV